MNIKLDWIYEILKKYDYFEIPYYQRKYTWEIKNEIQEFLGDIEKFIEKNEDLYFLGNIITKSYNTQDINYAIMIDGQQRITTFLLCICSYKKSLELIYDKYKYNENFFLWKWLSERIDAINFEINEFINNKFKKDVIKLQKINDQKYISYILMMNHI